MDTFFYTLYFVVFIFLTIVFTFVRRRGCHVDKAKLPPGSFGWPVMGETFEFLFGKPENFVTDRMKKFSPDIFKTRVLGEKTVVICGPNGNKFLFANENKLFTAFRPVPMTRLFRSYKDKASQSASRDEAGEKALRQPGFLKPEALVGYLGKMDTIIQELFQAHWQGKDDVKASPFAKTVTLTLACRFFMGTDDAGKIARLVKHFDDVTQGMHSIVLDFPGMVFYRANKAAAAIRKELSVVISKKKKEVASVMASSSGQKPVLMDILSYMILATDPNGKFMPEAELADKMMGLLVAGYSTVATAITFLMKYVGENPDIYNLIRQEQMEIAASKKLGEPLQWADVQKMKYSWNVICETMRLTPPIQGTFRQVLQDFTYAGYTIPKGWKLYWTMSSTNKDPSYFKDPEKFDPSRYEGDIVPYTYVPFGGGPRTCPGKEYARFAILAFLHNVVKRYSWELTMPDEKIIGDMMPTPANGLPIRLYHL
ncbi:hypothetical protein Leryth_009100 [Lithospermum erythrorhizon]|nr:hypothetical protein Leryth_009100 [Lithospermum erythrorhizon]